MKKIFATFIALLVVTSAYMQTTIPKAQTLFIYNFSRLIEWPASYKTGNFIIGTLGVTDVTAELESYSKGKKVGTQDIEVINYKTPEEIQNCQILFIPFSRTKQIAEVITALKGKSTLIITEKAGSLNEGAAINFVIIQDKMKFELKAENASKYGIKFSSKLNEMALTAAM
jgi:hypothetical protein